MGNKIVTNAVLQRVFLLNVGSQLGTGFIVEKNCYKYLVTAKHLFKPSYLQDEKVSVRTGEGFKEIDSKIYYHQDINIDIAVIKTSYFDNLNLVDVGYKFHGAYVSQEMFMLGFPYGCENPCYGINNGYPIPLVKKGIFSGGGAGGNIILDWDNNQGFSGGPVVYRELYDNDEFSEKEYIAGVITGYIPHKIPVFDKNTGEEIGLAEENSGIGIACDIKYAIEIIDNIV